MVLTTLVVISGLTGLFADALIPSGASGYSRDVGNLFYVVLGIAGFFFVLVIGLLTVFIVRYRATKTRTEGEAIHGNTPLEIVWTVIPFIVMIVLAVISTELVTRQWHAPADTLIVKVTAFQYGWKFEYFRSSPNGNADETTLVGNICGDPAAFVKIRRLGVKTSTILYLPGGENVRFLVTSTDVIHSFWLPDFLIKRDTVPGLMVDMWFKPDRVGNFPLRCAELCGPEHSLMTGEVRVIPQAEFDTWLAKQQQEQKI